MTKHSLYRWGGYWWYPRQAMARNKLGETHHHEHFLFDNGDLIAMRTKKEAKEYINKNYGYIKTRKDLRAYPHFWRVPKVVRIKITVSVAKTKKVDVIKNAG